MVKGVSKMYIVGVGLKNCGLTDKDRKGVDKTLLKDFSEDVGGNATRLSGSLGLRVDLRVD